MAEIFFVIIVGANNLPRTQLHMIFLTVSHAVMQSSCKEAVTTLPIAKNDSTTYYGGHRDGTDNENNSCAL